MLPFDNIWLKGAKTSSSPFSVKCVVGIFLTHLQIMSAIRIWLLFICLLCLYRLPLSYLWDSFNKRTNRGKKTLRASFAITRHGFFASANTIRAWSLFVVVFPSKISQPFDLIRLLRIVLSYVKISW